MIDESLKSIEKYAQIKTSDIIQEISRDESLTKISKIKHFEPDVNDFEEDVEETYKAIPESREESRRKSKRNK